MRWCAVFFMGNSLSDPKDLLIAFFGKFESDRLKSPKSPFSKHCDIVRS
jgi:hypothetical protein